jgi:hypothetical protein
MVAFTRRAFLAAAVATVAAAQAPPPPPTIGTDVCSCAPSSYVFSFNFSGTCETSTLKTGQPGLNETGCLVDRGDDRVPVSLTSVLIADLDQDLQSIIAGQEANLTSTDTIVYDAFTKTADAGTVDPAKIPRGVAVIMKGVNAAGANVQMSIAIIYTQECDIYPIVSAGDSVGWLVIVSFSQRHKKRSVSAPESLVCDHIIIIIMAHNKHSLCHLFKTRSRKSRRPRWRFARRHQPVRRPTRPPHRRRRPLPCWWSARIFVPVNRPHSR